MPSLVANIFFPKWAVIRAKQTFAAVNAKVAERDGAALQSGIWPAQELCFN